MKIKSLYYIMLILYTNISILSSTNSQASGLGSETYHHDITEENITIKKNEFIFLDGLALFADKLLDIMSQRLNDRSFELILADSTSEQRKVHILRVDRNALAKALIEYHANDKVFFDFPNIISDGHGPDLKEAIERRFEINEIEDDTDLYYVAQILALKGSFNKYEQYTNPSFDD